MRQRYWFHVLAALRRLGAEVLRQDYAIAWVAFPVYAAVALRKMTVPVSVQLELLRLFQLDEAEYLAALPPEDAPNEEDP